VQENTEEFKMKTVYSVLCPWQGKLYYFATESAANRFASEGNLQSVRKLNPGLKKSKLKDLIPFLHTDHLYHVHADGVLKSGDVGGAVEQIRQYIWEMQQYDLKVKGARDD
jgi:YHS domain-containing protein